MGFSFVFLQKRRNAQIFKSILGYNLNYDTPKSFNEKLNWLKFNYRDPLMTQCSGKDSVRDYVMMKLGLERASRYLTKTVGEGVYEAFDDIDINTLPDAFALKASNGSGKNVICDNKANFDIESARSKFEEWLKPAANHYYNYYEWGYKNVKATILCEEFLGAYGEVRDYKFFCFNGQPEFIYVSDEFDDHKGNIDMDYLTLDWESIGYVRKSYKPPKVAFKRPDSLEEMIAVAKELSEPFPFVRVDFFEVDAVPKVAEMTFYPAAGYGGFEDSKHDYEIGKLLSLPPRLHPARLIDWR